MTLLQMVDKFIMETRPTKIVFTRQTLELLEWEIQQKLILVPNKYQTQDPSLPIVFVYRGVTIEAEPK